MKEGEERRTKESNFSTFYYVRCGKGLRWVLPLHVRLTENQANQTYHCPIYSSGIYQSSYQHLMTVVLALESIWNRYVTVLHSIYFNRYLIFIQQHHPQHSNIFNSYKECVIHWHCRTATCMTCWQVLETTSENNYTAEQETTASHSTLDSVLEMVNIVCKLLFYQWHTLSLPPLRNLILFKYYKQTFNL